jgi:hypothetical protein
VTNKYAGKVRGAQLCKTSKTGAASIIMVPAKIGQAPAAVANKLQVNVVVVAAPVAALLRIIFAMGISVFCKGFESGCCEPDGMRFF